MESHPFGDRDVRFGDGARWLLPHVVTDLGARRVLLVTGGRSFKASGAAVVRPALDAVAEVTHWAGVTPNVDSAALAGGLAAMDRARPDLVVGIGGGSTLDMAKLLCAHQGLAEVQAVEDRIRSGAAASRRTGLVLVPTTSGSGSEATRFAVVYVDGTKHSVAGEALLPDVVVLDPQLTSGTSAGQRATSGIDAVAQAIESLWAVAADGASRRAAGDALALLLPAIEGYVHGEDPALARAMAVGSHLAGRAIDRSRTTAAHALSYGLTTRFGLPHGHAVGLTLAPFLAVHATADRSALREGVDPDGHAVVMRQIAAALGADTPGEAPEHFRALLVRLGLEPRLSVAAGRVVDVETLARGVDPQRLANNPVELTHEDLVAVLQQSG